jgi:caffeoyl-CoA O-methyltransferase
MITLDTNVESTARPVTPLSILAEKLANLLQQCHTLSLPPQVLAELQQSWQLASRLDPYLVTHTTAESSAMALLATRTAEENWSQRFAEGATQVPLEQEMLSGHVEGQTLKLFIHMLQAKKVLEIGMFTGYSALAMAEALPADGQLIACEVDAYVAEFAQAAFQESPHGAKIRAVLGPALDTLKQLAAAGETFDFVFLDADKAGYVAYFETLLNTNLLPVGRFMAVDNTLFQGQVYLPPEQRTANGQAIAQFNQIVAADPRVEQVILPLRDGLTLIRRVS